MPIKLISKMILHRSEYFLHFLVLDLRVEFAKSLLVLLEIVEGTVMILRLTMLGAEYI